MADTFVIRFGGHLEAAWSEYLYDLSMMPLTDGTTLLYAPLLDPSALYGLLARLRDLGLSLLLVIKADSKPRFRTLKREYKE